MQVVSHSRSPTRPPGLGLPAATALIVCLGCGPSNGRLAVSGTVSLDGAPLDEGIITFADPTGANPSAGALITDGEYRIPDGKGLLPGDYRVAIDSAEPAGGTTTALPGGMVVPVSRIPPQYNAATTLEASVAEDGRNEFAFNLQAAE